MKIDTKMVTKLNDEVYDKIFQYFISQTDREKMEIHRKIQELKQLVESVECEKKESEIKPPIHKIQQIAKGNGNKSLVLRVQSVPLFHAKLIVTSPSQEYNKQKILTSNFNENISSSLASTPKSFSQFPNDCSLSDNFPEVDREEMTPQSLLENIETELFNDCVINEEQTDCGCQFRQSEDRDTTHTIDSAYVSRDSLNQWDENLSTSSFVCDGEEPVLEYLPVSYAHVTLKKKPKWMKRWNSDISSNYYFCRTYPEDGPNSVKKVLQSVNKKWRQNWLKDPLEENKDSFQKSRDNCQPISARVLLERFLFRMRQRGKLGLRKNAFWGRSWSTPTSLNVLTSSKYRYQQWRAKSK